MNAICIKWDQDERVSRRCEIRWLFQPYRNGILYITIGWCVSLTQYTFYCMLWMWGFYRTYVFFITVRRAPFNDRVSPLEHYYTTSNICLMDLNKMQNREECILFFLHLEFRLHPINIFNMEIPEAPHGVKKRVRTSDFLFIDKHFKDSTTKPIFLVRVLNEPIY